MKQDTETTESMAPVEAVKQQTQFVWKEGMQICTVNLAFVVVDETDAFRFKRTLTEATKDLLHARLQFSLINSPTTRPPV